MGIIHSVELYQHSAAILFQCIFLWLLITVQCGVIEYFMYEIKFFRLRNSCEWYSMEVNNSFNLKNFLNNKPYDVIDIYIVIYNSLFLFVS